MIPANDITAWAHGAPWPTPTQVEQDLLLSQLICLIARDDYLGDELVFRGGTCLHKLHLHPARRYSEDLDYVRTTAGGIGQVTGAISHIGAGHGYEVRTRMSAQPKVYLRYTAESGTTRKIKVEVNTHERSPGDLDRPKRACRAPRSGIFTGPVLRTRLSLTSIDCDVFARVRLLGRARSRPGAMNTATDLGQRGWA